MKLNPILVISKIILGVLLRSTSPDCLSFAKLVMVSSTVAKSVGDARYVAQDPLTQSTFVLGVRSFFVECKNGTAKIFPPRIGLPNSLQVFLSNPKRGLLHFSLINIPLPLLPFGWGGGGASCGKE